MNEQLFFWHFFKAIELSLSYERWLDKYRLFVAALMQGQIPVEEDLRSFRRFCRILYLQDSRDEKRFDELLDAAIAREGAALYRLLDAALAAANMEIPQAPPPAEPPAPAPEPQNVDKKADTGAEENRKTKNRKTKDDSPEETQAVSKTMYYKTPLAFGEYDQDGGEPFPADPRFLHTDEYFSLTRRNMVKGWQFLRFKERGFDSTEVDVPATAFKIARDGLFLAPVFRQGTRNREDTLIILADVQGSMMPFHELTNRLIATAQHDGGHGRAPVYYFQNFPAGYVYRKANLAGPVKLGEALRKSNRNVTLAVVISDAGAARGNTDKGRVRLRKQQTDLFLQSLREHCARVLWLNPVPRHRWPGTASDNIKHLNMVSVFEQDVYNFQDTLRAIFKQKV
ncbi:hypothetical protein [Chitinophaga caseinilytica]|uniref:VWA containing CoxE family protein n=1 Tax=Chitinophaga caseinilytica TaxID=2267521 RepID=A0ABZ2Z345_9BACT